MIPNETLQTIDTIGQTSQVANFRITQETQARLLMTVSDRMYTRKQLAVVREYSTNAADAHVIAGKTIDQIQVFLPTMEDLNFRIRDFGSGLSELEIRDVYCVLGESLKRSDNRLNGVLGYGCKAGFADADVFTVTSWINGERSIYQCIKGDSTKLPASILISREASTDLSGLEICVPVKQGDWYTYHREAINFYRNWPTMPTINRLSDEDRESLNKWRNTPATLKGEGWEVRPKVDGNANAVAYMGWVPYNIDGNVLYHKMTLDSKTRALFELLRANDVILYFSMGEINFVDSREHLEYTDITINALVARIKEIFAKIKDSIQEKFVGIANLWDAKIMYNAIFGTGLIEVEKGEGDVADVTTRIKILDGNLMALENTFKGAFTWEGITLDGSGWFDINRFDNAFPSEIQSDTHEPQAPVLITYRKKKTRVKANRCSADKAERIMASAHTIVIINDTGRKHGQQMAARYLIHGHENRYRTVYVLTFEQQSLKDLFFKETHFDSVPVTYLTNLMPEAKKWNSANKVARNYGGGGGGVRPMLYLDIDQGTIEENEVPIREIEDGGHYILAADTTYVGRRRRGREREKQYNVRGKEEYTSYEAESMAASLATVCEELDIDADRIYVITPKTAESKWFNQAKESGDWKLIWEAIEEAMPNLTVSVDYLVDAENYEGTTKVARNVAKILVPKVMDKNSPMLKLIKTVGDRNFDMYVKIKDAFDGIGQWLTLKGNHKGTVDFEKSAQEAQAAYPFMPWNTLEYDNNATDEEMTKIARYVNALDVYVYLTKDTTPIEQTKVELPKESEAVAA
jgi:hypothetical protein